MNVKSLFLLVLICSALNLFAQQISKEELIFLTPQWKGERFSDGRPKAPDALIQRLKSVTLEEAWGSTPQRKLQTSVR